MDEEVRFMAKTYIISTDRCTYKVVVVGDNVYWNYVGKKPDGWDIDHVKEEENKRVTAFARRAHEREKREAVKHK